jgi:hypothetical protein
MTEAAEIYYQPTRGRMAALAHRARESARARMRGLIRRLSRPARPAAAAVEKGPGPYFALSGFEAPFAELEAILFSPEVLAAAEAAPPAPFLDLPPPALRLPHGADGFAARPRRRAPFMVDLIPMSLEFDLLELRLMQLFDLVDRFIVVEAPRSYGGARKPLYLNRNRSRFERFASKLVYVQLPEAAIGGVYARAVRAGSGYAGDVAMHVAMWKALRESIELTADTIVISSDLDEIPSRALVQLLREREVPLPLRVRMPTLRYRFDVADPETEADILLLSSADAPRLDANGMLIRDLPAPVIRARGTVHLTSFSPPIVLIAKFAMTTDWDEGIVPFIRNEHDETARMMAEPTWFSRPLPSYDAERDPDGLIPWYARANRARYAGFWSPAGSRPPTR